jgi:hypothetical protein
MLQKAAFAKEPLSVTLVAIFVSLLFLSLFSPVTTTSHPYGFFR